MNYYSKKWTSKRIYECTACEYCMPCPAGVNIPKNFALYNQSFMYNDLEGCKKMYSVMPEEAKSTSCLSCGKCEKSCPQHLQIRELLQKVTTTLNLKRNTI